MSQPLSALLRIAYLVSLSLWAGGSVFFSFLTTPKIFGYVRDRLPMHPPPGLGPVSADVARRLAGEVVGALFPHYFGLQVIAGVLAATSAVALAWHAARLEKLRAAFTVAALVLVAVHAAAVYPPSVRVLRESYQAREAGDTDGAERLYRRFGMWHGISQLLNLATILLVTAAVVAAALGLRDTRVVSP
jgi:hypothetical protein